MITEQEIELLKKIWLERFLIAHIDDARCKDLSWVDYIKFLKYKDKIEEEMEKSLTK